MEVKTVKLSELTKPEKNIRIHSPQQLREFERSVKMFGQIRPIVIDEHNVILAGNGLYDTLVQMGRETVDVYQYKGLTEKQKKKLMIADNRIYSLGIDNLDALNNFLAELGDDLDVPGFDEDILRQMTADAEEITEKISEYGALEQDEIEAIKNRSLKSNSGDSGSNGAENPENGPDRPTDENMQEAQVQTAEDGNFIICPNCGQKIWL